MAVAGAGIFFALIDDGAGAFNPEFQRSWVLQSTQQGDRCGESVAAVSVL
jgi:hypothetical protein